MQYIRERYGEVLSPENINDVKAALYESAGRLFGFDVSLTADGTFTYVTIDHNTTGRDKYAYVNGVLPLPNKFGAVVNNQGVLAFDDFNGNPLNLPIRIGLVSPPITGNSVVTVVAYLEDTGSYQVFNAVSYALLIGATAQTVPDNACKIADIYITGTFTEGDDISAQAEIVPFSVNIQSHANTQNRNVFNKLQTLEGLALTAKAVTYNSSTRTLEAASDSSFIYYDSGTTGSIRVDDVGGKVTGKILFLEARSALELQSYRSGGNFKIDNQLYLPQGTIVKLMYDGADWLLLDGQGLPKYDVGVTVVRREGASVQSGALTLKGKTNTITLSTPLTTAYLNNPFSGDIPSDGAQYTLRVEDPNNYGFTVQHDGQNPPVNAIKFLNASGANDTYYGTRTFLVTDYGTFAEVVDVSSSAFRPQTVAFDGTSYSIFANTNQIYYKREGRTINLYGTFNFNPSHSDYVNVAFTSAFNEVFMDLTPEIRPTNTIIINPILELIGNVVAVDAVIQIEPDGKATLSGVEMHHSGHTKSEIVSIKFSATYLL